MPWLVLLMSLAVQHCCKCLFPMQGFVLKPDCFGESECWDSDDHGKLDCLESLSGASGSMMQLTNMMSTLERALGTAQERANRLDLQPLATQLHEAAGKLRQSANGSSALVNPIAERLDTAAGDLIQV